MLEDKTMIRCNWCGKCSTLLKWNETTSKKCTTREMKRAYIPLYQDKAFKKSSDTFYLCPKCSAWSRGSQLKIVGTDDKELLKLGGEPLVTIVKKGNSNNDNK